eukprot:2791303-Pleurochrysis_carterae.AAC.3
MEPVEMKMFVPALSTGATKSCWSRCVQEWLQMILSYTAAAILLSSSAMELALREASPARASSNSRGEEKKSLSQ